MYNQIHILNMHTVQLLVLSYHPKQVIKCNNTNNKQQ